MTLTQFLNTAFPNCTFTITGEDYSSIIWAVDNLYPLPSEAYITDWMHNTAKDYFELRSASYPPVGEQLDMIYHAGQGGDEFQAAISAVKDAYPKPENNQ